MNAPEALRKKVTGKKAAEEVERVAILQGTAFKLRMQENGVKKTA